jgi:hypothetical protein
MSAAKRTRTDRENVAPLVVFNLVNSYPVERHRHFERSIYRSEYNITHNLSEYSNLFDIEYEIDNMLDEIISPLIARAQRNDVVLAYIRHSSLEKPIFITPQKAGSFEPKSFLDAIFGVSQSNRIFLLDGELALEVSMTKPLENIGVNSMTTLKELEKRKKVLFAL